MADSRRHECARCAVGRSRGTLATGPCEVCGCKDLRVLSRVQLASGWANLCANHEAIAGKLGLTLAELRLEAAAGAAA